MRTESVKSKCTLKSKTQSIETSVMKLTRTKAISISDKFSAPTIPEEENTHTPLSRASSLPTNMANFSIERDPLPIGSDVFQSVLKEISDETCNTQTLLTEDSSSGNNDNQQNYHAPKLKKTSSLRRTQSERIPGRSVRFSDFEIDGRPSQPLQLSTADLNI